MKENGRAGGARMQRTETTGQQTVVEADRRLRSAEVERRVAEIPAMAEVRSHQVSGSRDVESLAARSGRFRPNEARLGGHVEFDTIRSWRRRANEAEKILD